ncbi:glyoxylate reductase/hydroxypyruvate reductase-like [Mercenaria mercenaria]|uniref:glyoxylate reductase/hydroxypyruvate reductase-like n=1 Tax=Mercenaria mercenaria TaxID=6596 RepID=UPI00234E54AE|nr:glyoxylate reductase/hydroxypyruvate reductase-like [Mercenaria mercenaria]
MAKPKVFVTRRVPQEGIDILGETCDVDVWNSDDVVPRETFLERVKGVSGLFCTINDEIDTEVLDAAGPSLKVVGTMSVGNDHINIPECKQRRICVATTPDVASDSAAELSVALLLITTRRLAEGLSAIKSGESGPWKPMWCLGTLSMGKTLGIFGFGRVGFGIARRMKPFGVSRIIYSDLFVASYADGIAERVTFDELLQESDILCVCCAVTSQTVKKFNKTAFQKMKKTAVLINTSRGSVVNQTDLYEALSNNVIGAAGLDVTEPEPLPVDHPLMTLNNCIILPHMGTNTYEARKAMSINTAKNIIAILE